MTFVNMPSKEVTHRCAKTHNFIRHICAKNDHYFMELEFKFKETEKGGREDTLQAFVTVSSSDTDPSSSRPTDVSSYQSETELSYDDSTASSLETTQEEEEERRQDSPVEDFTKNLPVRMLIDGCLFVRRKTTSTREYWYCNNDKCKAGYIYTINDKSWRSNNKPHNHPQGDVDRFRKENREDFLLRKFVFENRSLDARDIYAKLLEQHERGVEDFQNIGKVDLKQIQNIKEQLAGQISRKALESVLPRELSMVDNKQFLVFQAVQPVILIFATEESRERLCAANTCVILKLPVDGPTLKNVYCVYTLSGGAVIPAMWVMFDERGTEMAWIQVKLLLEDTNGQGRPLNRMWIAPFSQKYIQIMRQIIRQNDAIRGIDASVTRKIAKICNKIEDEATQSKVRHFFVSVAAGPFQAMSHNVECAMRSWTEPAAQQALAQWNDCFGSYLFMYHCSARCYDIAVKEIYESRKANKANHPTDEEVIKAVQRSYIVPEAVAELSKRSETSPSKDGT